MSIAQILVVEDEAIVGMGLQAQLQSLGYAVPTIAMTGEQAVREAEARRPDLVLMDIRLDGAMDGVAAAGIIRRRFGIPIVFLTAYSNESILERARVTEPYGYILKPFEERELHVVVEMALYRSRMERQAHEREQWFAATLQSIGDGVIAVNPEGKITFMNPIAEQLTGWSQGEALGRAETEVFRVVHEQTGEPVASPLQRAREIGRPVPLANHSLLLGKDGQARPIDDCAAPIIDAQGRALGGVLVFRDVSERRRAEAALAKLAAIVECCTDAIVGADLEGIITSWNDGAAHLYGYTAAEALGQPLSILIPAGAASEFQSNLERLGKGEPVRAYETERQKKDGTVIEVIATLSPVRTRDGVNLGVAAIHRDISHVKRLEAQYRQAQKMEAVGRLAGGVAHDFNNLLMVINGYSELVLRGLHEHDKHRGLIEEVCKAGDRAAGLTRQLLAYSRKQILQLQVFDLSRLIGDMEKLLRSMLGEDVQLVLTLDPALRPIKADRSQLEQVLMNLVVNSRDAMPAGGKLTIETKDVDFSTGYADQYMDLPAGPYVLLAVSDTGTGMSAETLSHLFEPFFTTKEVGKGTGLGLATVYGIVKQNSGHIRVYSEPGLGTAFKIYFPSFQDTPDAELRPAQQEDFPQGTETILVVEDETGVRSLTRLVLQRCGYTVLDAPNGADAIDIAARHQGPIDLLITDVVMPGMSGRTVAETLLVIYPHLRVMFLSGYTDDAVIRHGILESEVAFLQKPFPPVLLAHKVREVLDHKGF